MIEHNFAEAFLKNRAELLPDDVWGQFIVPHFISSTAVLKEKKAVKIEGGRGCGKTILMRYLCHATTFSRNRKNIPDTALGYIGLYWKPDIRFCKLLTSDWLESYSDIAFEHYFSLSVLEALCDCVDSISAAHFEHGSIDLNTVQLPPTIGMYFDGNVNSFSELANRIRTERAQFNLWVQNPRREQPLLFQFKDIFTALLDTLASTEPRLKNSFFRIFVDEFENLQPSQQLIINDYIKQPQSRFCVSFSVRSHAISEFFTSTAEQLIDPHDYRTINIENEFLKTGQANFELIAAEVTLLRLHNENFDIGFPEFDVECLFDPRFLDKRNNDEYRKAVLARVRRIFPQMTSTEIAQLACTDSALRNRLEKAILQGLERRKRTDIPISTFFDGIDPRVSVVAASVLHRDKPETDEIIEQVRMSVSNPAASAFTKREGGWVQNTLYATLFYLYQGLPNTGNLLYSGFKRYCGMSQPNLRYFQELCHQAFLEANLDRDNKECADPMVVPPKTQAFAALQVSTKLVNEVERAGANGKSLHNLIMRLGHLFEAAQRRPAQGEPEVNHFSIDEADSVALKDDVHKLLKEALMWSILYRTDDTKNKSDYDIVQNDYVPNPIYAPYFGISYRKKRKLALKAEQINTIFLGTGTQYQDLLKNYTNKWMSSKDNILGTNYDMFS